MQQKLGPLSIKGKKGFQPIHGHGAVKTRTYRIWKNMRNRCMSPTNPDYDRYGGRGITICERWAASFLNFLEDMGEAPDSLTLERKNNDGPYSPDNCKWATRKEQSRNQANTTFLNLNGIRLPLTEWAEQMGVPAATLKYRVQQGWSDERVLTEPIKQRI